MKRNGIILFFALCLTAFLYLWWFQRNPIDQTIYDAIELGMTDEDVMNRVPMSPRVEAFTRLAKVVASQGKTEFGSHDVIITVVESGTFRYFDGKTKEELGTTRSWQTDRCSLQVYFSPDGTVVGKKFYRHDTNGSWWSNLRHMLRHGT